MINALAVGRSERLLGFVFSTYILFLVGFFYIPNAVDLYKYYTVALLLPSLFLLYDGLAIVRRSALFFAILSYLFYMLLSPLWGEGFDWQAYLNYLRLALYVVVFIMITIMLHQRWPAGFLAALSIVSLLVGTAAVVSMLLWHFDIIHGPRLIGTGILVNPNPSGYAYAIFAIMNLFFITDRSLQAAQRVLHLFAFLALFSYVFFTYSRGALLALTAATLVIFIGRRSRLMWIALLLLLVAAALMYFESTRVFSLLDRGIGARPEIWKMVLSRIQEAPFFGHGYLSDQHVKLEGRHSIFVFAHNAYLASFRDGGIIGGLLLFVMLGVGLYQAWRIGQVSGDFQYLAMLVLALVCMMFDTDRLLTRPRELWVVLWLPVALIISNYLQIRNAVLRTPVSE